MTNSTNRPRMILVDDNIRDIGGHFYELATLLLQAGESNCYQPVLCTHQSFQDLDAVDSQWIVKPTFQTRRLVQWSIGVDGQSRFARGLDGRYLAASSFAGRWASVTEAFGRPSKRPKKMLNQWAEDFECLIRELQPSEHDQIVINTGDDFCFLAIAQALSRMADLPRLQIKILFHFAIFESTQPNIKDTLGEYRRQMNLCFDQLRSHDISVFATTASLAAQMRRADLAQSVGVIPYPTRLRTISQSLMNEPLKIVMAGLPRAEKGRGFIEDFLGGVHSGMQDGRYVVSMQMRSDRWQTMIPKSMHSEYTRSVQGDQSSPLEIMTDNLSTVQYHDWLDTADVGLFLYQPQRYEARCSGVLLELMTRGVPVIVPKGSWLSDQVNAAGGNGSVGFIYESPDEIPSLLQQLCRQRVQISTRSREHAVLMQRQHSATNTLKVMGIHSPPTSVRAA